MYKTLNIKCVSQTTKLEEASTSVMIECEEPHTTIDNRKWCLDYPTRLDIDGPDEIKPGAEDIFNCSTDPSYPSVNLRWKVNDILVEEGVERYIHEKEHSAISTSSFRLTMHGSAAQVTLICFVDGMPRELKKQKLVNITGDILAIFPSIVLLSKLNFI